MAAPSTLVRTAVKAIITAEFTGTYTVADDKLPRAAGRKGATKLACYPVEERVDPRNQTHLIVPVVLQFYMAYVAEVNEEQVVNPATIETIGDRIRRRTAQFTDGTTPDLWFLNLTEIEYPDDPTGNKTRLEATFEGHCENPSVQ